VACPGNRHCANCIGTLSERSPYFAASRPTQPSAEWEMSIGQSPVMVCSWTIKAGWLVTDTHTHPFNGPLSRTTRVSQYQKRKTNLDFTGARDSEWQWHQLGHMQVCTSLQTVNNARTPPLSFLQAGCPSCRPTNSVKALKCGSFHLWINASVAGQTDWSR